MANFAHLRLKRFLFASYESSGITNQVAANMIKFPSLAHQSRITKKPAIIILVAWRVRLQTSAYQQMGAPQLVECKDFPNKNRIYQVPAWRWRSCSHGGSLKSKASCFQQFVKPTIYIRQLCSNCSWIGCFTSNENDAGRVRKFMVPPMIHFSGGFPVPYHEAPPWLIINHHQASLTLINHC